MHVGAILTLVAKIACTVGVRSPVARVVQAVQDCAAKLPPLCSTVIHTAIGGHAERLLCIAAFLHDIRAEYRVVFNFHVSTW